MIVVMVQMKFLEHAVSHQKRFLLFYSIGFNLAVFQSIVNAVKMNFDVLMVDVFQNDGLRIIFHRISKVHTSVLLNSRVCDHDYDCGGGDTSDESVDCGKIISIFNPSLLFKIK